jgi:uncharacterized membrane protein YgdD (TMEM256/DUF423 family)
MRSFFFVGIVFCLLSVILGAFAAHGLKNIINTQSLSVFQTGVQYQFYHGIALLVLSVAQPQLMFTPSQIVYAKRAGFFFVVGTVLFSGSLYLLATTSMKAFGPMTPIGGVCFIIGWLLMFIAVIKK